MREYFIWLAKLLTVLALVFVGIPFLIGITAALLGGFMADGLPSMGKTVAVVELDGEISDSKDVVKELYRQAESSRVRGTVLRVNSPGGAVAPSQDIYETVRTLNAKMPKKPIVVSMGSVAASGGLYASLGARKIFAQPGTMTGSIGVIMQLPNVQKLAGLVGVNFVTIKSGQLKDVGNMFREMTPAERDFLQATVLRVHQDFVDAVAEGRGIPRDEVLKFADGRVIIGSQAKDLHLVDELGDVYDAARSIFELAGEPLGEGEFPKLYYPFDKFKDLRHALDSTLSIARIFSAQPEFKYLMQSGL